MPAVHDWRSPGARARRLVRDGVLVAAGLAGRFEGHRPADLEARSSERVAYDGDTRGPRGADGRPFEERLVFAIERPVSEDAADILYTERGMAWRQGRLVERFSIRRPSLAELARKPRAAAQIVERGVVVEAEVPYTYGDWLNNYFGTALAAAEAGLLDGPLVVPQVLAAKSYAARDLKLARLDVVVADSPRLIRRARILRKRAPMNFWTTREIAAYQRRLAPDRPAPRPGSLTYLARYDMAGETPTRRFPSEAVAALVETMGGRTIRQENLSPEFAATIADGMETVIADHGSGLMNLLHWRAKHVVEIATADWWTNNNLFLAHDLGVRDFALVVHEGDGAATADKVRARLQAFGVGAG